MLHSIHAKQYSTSNKSMRYNDDVYIYNNKKRKSFNIS